MYLDIRDTNETVRDVKGENSRIVMIIIGSTILLTIIVCLAISPIRRLKYVLFLPHHSHPAALHAPTSKPARSQQNSRSVLRCANAA